MRSLRIGFVAGIVTGLALWAGVANAQPIDRLSYIERHVSGGFVAGSVTSDHDAGSLRLGELPVVRGESRTVKYQTPGTESGSEGDEISEWGDNNPTLDVTLLGYSHRVDETRVYKKLYSFDGDVGPLKDTTVDVDLGKQQWYAEADTGIWVRKEDDGRLHTLVGGGVEVGGEVSVFSAEAGTTLLHGVVDVGIRGKVQGLQAAARARAYGEFDVTSGAFRTGVDVSAEANLVKVGIALPVSTEIHGVAARVTPYANVGLGIGAHAKYEFEVSLAGKTKITAEAGAYLGVGADIGLQVEVDTTDLMKDLGLYNEDQVKIYLMRLAKQYQGKTPPLDAQGLMDDLRRIRDQDAPDTRRSLAEAWDSVRVSVPGINNSLAVMYGGRSLILGSASGDSWIVAAAGLHTGGGVFGPATAGDALKGR